MLTGRWWEGRILINLCGKNNVRNCDLLQSDFFARCRTVLRIFLAVWWNLEKDEVPKRCDFLSLRNMLLKASFPSSYLGLVKATLAALKKWLPSRTACYNFLSVKNTSLSQECIIYSLPFGWAATPYSPAKRSDSASQKQADLTKCFGKPPYLTKLLRWFVPDPTFGLIRFSWISTAISAPPLQPTQSLCFFQN